MNLIKVEFKNDVIEVIDNYLSVRKICENLGLVDFNSQYKKIQLDETFESKFINIEINGIIQNVFCIPLNKLNGWLFSINPNKVKPQVKQKLIEYKEECFEVLHNHFMPKQPLFKTTAEERVGTLELQVEALKREVIEAKRLDNRVEYNYGKYGAILANSYIVQDNEDLSPKELLELVDKEELLAQLHQLKHSNQTMKNTLRYYLDEFDEVYKELASLKQENARLVK